jgi:hypothetical protein
LHISEIQRKIRRMETSTRKKLTKWIGKKNVKGLTLEPREEPVEEPMEESAEEAQSDEWVQYTHLVDPSMVRPQ